MDILNLLFIIILTNVKLSYSEEDLINYHTVSSWAVKFGNELWNVGKIITNIQKVNESFKDATVVQIVDSNLAQEITKDIEDMMNLKVSAVKRLSDTAEQIAMSENKKIEDLEDYQYYSSKELTPANPSYSWNTTNKNEVLLNPNLHFWNISVNTSFSSVHVPTNVFDRAKDVLSAIAWSEKLDKIFVSNYQQDPSLTWQYFGSSSGFMRQYPAMAWKQKPVDLYDCRTRSWYIEAANSPKDMVILVDHSGSMTGERKEIARHVVNNILDTLGSNDYVNVFNFTNETREVVPCFKDKLVQANLFNVRALKQGMEDCETVDIANFSYALNKAFQILQTYRDNETEVKGGAHCNQAIMLITDGVPDNFKEIFDENNWPDMPVRVFTYLVGREVADVREIKWMACANRGYYVHLSTMAEVREQVLKYVPVMARPLVLNRYYHPVIWTPVYADITDPKMTDYLWEQKQRAEQRERVLLSRKQISVYTKEEQDRRFVQSLEDSEDIREYKLMTSVSIPVYDLHDNITRAANLLGVAGTDVPISEIQKLLKPFQLGVNGYAFIVTNNGYVLCHPDLRPVFQGILKPNYNSVDMAEIELPDDSDGRRAREFNPVLLNIRRNIIDQKTGGEVMKVKYHFDEMKRATRSINKYFYRPINNSLFALVIVQPKIDESMRVHGLLEMRLAYNQHENITNYFGNNWKVHPDWEYCKYHYYSLHKYESPEAEVIDFIKKAKEPNWSWQERGNLRITPEQRHNPNSNRMESQGNKDAYYCDRELFLSLLFDAKRTKWFSENTSALEDSDEKQLTSKFGITVAFLATRSGLTRWRDYLPMEELKGDNFHFSEIHKRSINEIWYKRAVLQHYINPQSFVYSVPFEAGSNNSTVVTASHAVFKTVENKEAPAAVVGYQFLRTALTAIFFNVVCNCPTTPASCKVTCASQDLHCFVLDNNGYVVVSENSRQTGLFFGEIYGGIMEMLVDENLYQRILVYDYQAVCYRSTTGEDNSANYLMTPWIHVTLIWKWLIGQFLFLAANFGVIKAEFNDVYQQEDQEPQYSAENYADPTKPTTIRDKMPNYDNISEETLAINRTRPQTCDQEVVLYELTNSNNQNIFARKATGCDRPYVVQPIQNSNLILLVVSGLCQLDDIHLTVAPKEVQYNDSLMCHKLYNSDYLPRRRPTDCTSRHDRESEIQQCGLASKNKMAGMLVLLIIFCYFT